MDVVEAGVDAVPDEVALESAAGFDADSAGLLELVPDALGFALP